MRRSGQHARRRIVVEVRGALIAERDNGKRASVGLRIANGKYVVDLVRADERVDFRNLSFQLVAITLDEAAGDDQSFGVAVGFELSGFEDRVDRFLLG